MKPALNELPPAHPPKKHQVLVCRLQPWSKLPMGSLAMQLLNADLVFGVLDSNLGEIGNEDYSRQNNGPPPDVYVLISRTCE